MAGGWENAKGEQRRMRIGALSNDSSHMTVPVHANAVEYDLLRLLVVIENTYIDDRQPHMWRRTRTPENKQRMGFCSQCSHLWWQTEDHVIIIIFAILWNCSCAHCSRYCGWLVLYAIHPETGCSMCLLYMNIISSEFQIERMNEASNTVAYINKYIYVASCSFASRQRWQWWGHREWPTAVIMAMLFKGLVVFVHSNQVFYKWYAGTRIDILNCNIYNTWIWVCDIRSHR